MGSRLRDLGLLVIRLGIGLSYLPLHGWPKLSGGPAYWEQIGRHMAPFGITFAPVFWGFMGAFAETAGALLFALGLFFRPTAALLVVHMTVAVVSHFAAGEGWYEAAHALHMATVFLGLALIGPGQYSLDSRLKQRRRLPRRS